MNPYKKGAAKPYFVVVIHTILASIILYLSERTQKLIRAIDDKIGDEKLQHYLNREAVKK